MTKEQRPCPKHGITLHYLQIRGKCQTWRCDACNVDRVVKWRKNRKLTLIEYAGGQCKICGYKKCTAALDFHHKDPTQKEFNLSKGGSCRSLEKDKLEVDKCILVCSNCHREIHAGQLDISL